MSDEEATKEELDAYTEELGAQLGPESVETTLALDGTVLFWYTPLRPDQVEEIASHWVVGVSG
jgi:hypothetical protein